MHGHILQFHTPLSLVTMSTLRRWSNTGHAWSYSEVSYSIEFRHNEHSQTLVECWPCRILKSHTLLSLVTMRTLRHWSNAVHTHRPILSGLQSKPAMGCVDMVTFCSRFTLPATPIGTSFESCVTRLLG